MKSNMLTEINFDGIIGPSHNYAGLSLGNIASSNNAGAVSEPRVPRGPQPVAVELRTHRLAVRVHEERGAVPRLLHRRVVFVEALDVG